MGEVMEDLNSGKIQYAFLRISDPKTSIKKNILINWQVGCGCVYPENSHAINIVPTADGHMELIHLMIRYE